VPTGADRHPQVPTCADRDRRGQRLRGAVPPVPRGFVGTKFAVQGYSEDRFNKCISRGSLLDQGGFPVLRYLLQAFSRTYSV
jgi:hypothetical protein